MRKLRLVIISVAVFFGLTTAVASRLHQLCTGEPNYYWNGIAYMPAGQFGTDYICGSGSQICTYYRNDNGVYFQCRVGAYMPLGIKKK